MPEVSVTLKAGPSYSDPWINVRGASVDELSDALEELRDRGAFAAVKTIAKEFAEAAPANAPLSGADAVKAIIPGATVISDTAAAPAAPAPQAGQVQQSTPPCETCGAPTNFAKGTGRTGPWSAYFCTSGDRSHSKFL